MTAPDLPLSNRIALVTGASRGIGYATTIAFAKAGAHVIATARTQGGLEALDDEIFNATGEHATLVPMDLRNGDGIDLLGGQIFQRWGRLDVLASVAGDLGLITPAAHLEPRTWDRTIAVNLTANFRLIRSLEPLLRASEAGRALFVTAGRVARPKAFWAPYAAAKAGMESLVRCWADEMAHTNLRCVLVDPGAMRTKMRAAAFPGEDPATLPLPEAIGPLMIDLARADREPTEMLINFSIAASGA